MPKSRRKFTRIPVQVPVEYAGLEKFRPDNILDLSAGGTFICTTKPFPLDEPVTIKFDLPEISKKTLKVKGRVSWIAPAPTSKRGSRHPQGMALAFDPSEKDFMLLVDQFVSVTVAIKNADTRIGNELPASQRALLPKPEGGPKQLDLSDVDPFVKF